FSNVKAGTYRMSASLPGFQTMTAASQVAHDRSARQDFRLAVAAVNQIMVVAGAVAGQQGQQGGVVPPPAAAAPAVVKEEDRKRDLPLNGRAVFDRREVLQAPIDVEKAQFRQLQVEDGARADFGIAQAKAMLADRALRFANIMTVRE